MGPCCTFFMAYPCDGCHSACISNGQQSCSCAHAAFFHVTRRDEYRYAHGVSQTNSAMAYKNKGIVGSLSRLTTIAHILIFIHVTHTHFGGRTCTVHKPCTHHARTAHIHTCTTSWLLDRNPPATHPITHCSSSRGQPHVCTQTVHHSHVSHMTCATLPKLG
jgi:hypothetical protein